MRIDESPGDAAPFDVICLGRLAVDFYGEQMATSIEEARTFRRYVGGSSANLAVGCARQGLRTALISRVGADAMGRYLLKQLSANGVDIGSVSVDPVRRTPLAFLGMEGAEAIALDFYRHDPADLGISSADISEPIFKSAKALAVTATHLLEPGAAEAVRHAFSIARREGLLIVVDLDYRAALWPLHPGGLPGMVRDVAGLAALADVVVGNEEEFEIVGAAAPPPIADRFAGARGLRTQTQALLIVKLGADGVASFDGDIPESTDDIDVVPAYSVRVVNPVGAGDAFLSGYLAARLGGLPVRDALRRGNAAGAIVVSRHGCSDAMPSPRELEIFEASSRGGDLYLSETIAHAHRVAKRRPRTVPVTALAFDHREPFRRLMRETGRAEDDIRRFKQLIAEAALQVASANRLAAPGALVDATFGEPVLADLTDRDWFVARPVEVTGSRPLRFEAEADLEREIATWHPAHVAKCLVWHHPDDPEALRSQQIDQLKRLAAACMAHDREWALEVIPPRDQKSSDTVILAAVEQLYDAGLKPDFWKLQAFSTEDSWARLAGLISRFDPDCRGSLVLGLDQPLESLGEGLARAASQSACAGFAIGRSVFMDAARGWFAGEMSDAAAVAEIAKRFEAVVQIWREAREATLPLAIEAAQ